LILFYCGFIIMAGGDHMPAFRLILPIIPLFILLIYSCLSALQKQFSPLAIILLLLVVLVCIPTQLLSSRLNVQKKLTASFTGEIVGKYIAEAWPRGSLIALNTAGSTPYYALDLRFIDMLGLNDSHIARREIGPPELPWQKLPGHHKGDGAYVLSRKPDYIIIGPTFGTTVDTPWFLSDLELSRIRAFKESYQLEQVNIDVGHFAGYECYEQTRTGSMLFTYYQRKSSRREGS